METAASGSGSAASLSTAPRGRIKVREQPRSPRASAARTAVTIAGPEPDPASPDVTASAPADQRPRDATTTWSLTAILAGEASAATANGPPGGSPHRARSSAIRDAARRSAPATGRAPRDPAPSRNRGGGGSGVRHQLRRSRRRVAATTARPRSGRSSTATPHWPHRRRQRTACRPRGRVARRGRQHASPPRRLLLRRGPARRPRRPPDASTDPGRW